MSEVDSTVSVTQSPERKISTRKTNKPLMEKRRRARINSCLTELKSLVLQAVKKDNPQYSKLEKADILEMTVQHLRNLQRQHVTSAVACDPNVTTKYRAGFNECTNEVMRYLQGTQNVNEDVRSRVLNHLADCLPNSPGHKSETLTLNATASDSHNTAVTTQVPVVHPAFIAMTPTIKGNNQMGTIAVNLSPQSTDANNNKININSSCAPSFQSISGTVQLIPGTLPSGQVALFLASPPASATPSIAQAVPLYAAASPSTSVSLSSIAMTTATTPSPAFPDKSASVMGHIMYANSASVSNTLFTNKPLLINDDKMWRPW